MSDIVIEGKNLKDISQTNFQSVGPYTNENIVIEPWQGRNVTNDQEQDLRFSLGTITENNKGFWEAQTVDNQTRKSQIIEKSMKTASRAAAIATTTIGGAISIPKIN